MSSRLRSLPGRRCQTRRGPAPLTLRPDPCTAGPAAGRWLGRRTRGSSGGARAGGSFLHAHPTGAAPSPQRHGLQGNGLRTGREALNLPEGLGRGGAAGRGRGAQPAAAQETLSCTDPGGYTDGETEAREGAPCIGQPASPARPVAGRSRRQPRPSAPALPGRPSLTFSAFTGRDWSVCPVVPALAPDPRNAGLDGGLGRGATCDTTWGNKKLPLGWARCVMQPCTPRATVLTYRWEPASAGEGACLRPSPPSPLPHQVWGAVRGAGAGLWQLRGPWGQRLNRHSIPDDPTSPMGAAPLALASCTAEETEAHVAQSPSLPGPHREAGWRGFGQDDGKKPCPGFL